TQAPNMVEWQPGPQRPSALAEVAAPSSNIGVANVSRIRGKIFMNRSSVSQRGSIAPNPSAENGTGRISASRLLHELRLQVHGADAVDLAGDVVAVGGVLETDVADLGAALDDRRRALDLEVLHHDDAVAVAEHIAVGIAHAGLDRCVRGPAGKRAPFMAALRADPEIAILIGVFGAAGGAVCRGGHGRALCRGIASDVLMQINFRENNPMHSRN